MFKIDEDGTTFKVNRGSSGSFSFSAVTPQGEPYTFSAGDIIRFNITKANRTNSVLSSIDTVVEEDSNEVTISLKSQDTKVGNPINKPTEYWYDIELNPVGGNAQMLLGYDEEGPKIFTLYPESVKEGEI